jgi:hypothetical protein
MTICLIYLFPKLRHQVRAVRFFVRRLSRIQSSQRRDQLAREYGFADFETTKNYLQKLCIDRTKARRAETKKIKICKRNLSFLKRELRYVD